MPYFSGGTGPVKGCDISRWQTSVNFQTMRNAGAEFCAQRIGYFDGSTSQWDTVISNARAVACRAAGLKLGFYYYKDPDYGAGLKMTSTDAQNEATWLYNAISSITGSNADMGDMFPMLDLESTLGDPDIINDPDVTNDICVKYVNTFVQEFKALSGRQVILYSSWYTLSSLATSPDILVYSSTGVGVSAVAPLWLAAYDRFITSSTSLSLLTWGGYTDWHIRQYSDTESATTYGVSGTSTVDVNWATTFDRLCLPPETGNFQASAGAATITLSWTKNAYDTGTADAVVKYMIYADDGTTEVASVAIVATTAYSYQLTGLSGTYSYYLKAINYWGEKGLSVVASATTTGALPTGYQYTINIDSVNFVTGSQFRNGVNNAFATIANSWAGTTAPTETHPYQFWADTTNGKMQQRNGTNTAWVELYDLGTTIGAQDETGWTSAGETWEYASGTSFKVAGDKTTKYQKGDKIKLTSGSVVYSYLTSVAYSGSTTTFLTTVWAHSDGTSATFATGTISNNYYSRLEAPLGWPGWIPYAITIASTSGTYTAAGNRAWFKLRGKECILELSVYGSLNTSVTYLTGTFPTNCAPDDAAYIFRYSGGNLLTFQGGTYFSTTGTTYTTLPYTNVSIQSINGLAGWYIGSTSIFTIYKTNAQNFGPYAQTGFAGKLSYGIA